MWLALVACVGGGALAADGAPVDGAPGMNVLGMNPVGGSRCILSLKKSKLKV
jgi:hypothetical protein